MFKELKENMMTVTQQMENISKGFKTIQKMNKMKILELY